MIGDDPFCPKSGAPLSSDKHYDHRGRCKRAVSDTDVASSVGSCGELTSGSVRSSKTALIVYFRRAHARHFGEDGELYRRGALALKRLLKANSHQPLDIVVWYALQQRLAVLGYETGWMDSHGELHCPRCYGRLRFQRSGGALIARCGTNCDGRHTDMLAELREAVVELYSEAFSDEDISGDADVLR